MHRLSRTSRHHAATAAVIVLATLSLGLGACAGSSDASKAADTSTTTTAPVRAAEAGSVATGKPVPSSGCGRSKVAKLTLDKQFLDDSDRWYLLSTPPEHDGTNPVPLVLDIHGLAEGAQVHSVMTQMGPFAQENGFAVAFPNGLGAPARWEVKADRKQNPDLVFLDAVLDQLEARLCIDTSRIYATGLSNGAFMSTTLACTMSDRLAAVAPVAGITDPPGCKPSRPMPMLTFHGTADPILLFNGGINLEGVLDGGKVSGPKGGTDPSSLPKPDLEGAGYPANVKAWAKRNGCKDEFTEKAVTKTVTLRSYDCPADATVDFYIIDDGGHSWPGSEFSAKVPKIVGPTDMSIDADEIIWDFFQRYQLPET